VQAPLIRPGLLAAACDLEQQLKNLPSDLLDRRITGRNRRRIHIYQIVPSLILMCYGL